MCRGGQHCCAVEQHVAHKGCVHALWVCLHRCTRQVLAPATTLWNWHSSTSTHSLSSPVLCCMCSVSQLLSSLRWRWVAVYNTSTPVPAHHTPHTVSELVPARPVSQQASHAAQHHELRSLSRQPSTELPKSSHWPLPGAPVWKRCQTTAWLQCFMARPCWSPCWFLSGTLLHWDLSGITTAKHSSPCHIVALHTCRPA